MAPINLVMKAADQISTGEINAEIRYSSPTEIVKNERRAKFQQLVNDVAYPPEKIHFGFSIGDPASELL